MRRIARRSRKTRRTVPPGTAAPCAGVLAASGSAALGGILAEPPVPERPVPRRSELRRQVKEDPPPERWTGKKVSDSYTPEMADQAMEWLRDGAGLYSLARRLGASVATLHRWCLKHPEFGKAIEVGLDMSRGWWEDVARLNLTTRGFNTFLWAVNMHNRFGWSRTLNVEPGELSGGTTINASITNNTVDIRAMPQRDLEDLRSLLERHQRKALTVGAKEETDGEGADRTAAASIHGGG